MDIQNEENAPLVNAVETVETLEARLSRAKSKTSTVLLLTANTVFHVTFYGFVTVWTTLFEFPEFKVWVQNNAGLLSNVFSGFLYLSSLFGGLISDRVNGMYGMCLLGMTFAILGLVSGVVSSRILFQELSFVAVGLFAVGAGFVKSVISSLLGEQIVPDEQSAEETERVFSYYFWTIQLGAIPATIAAPIVLTHMSQGHLLLFSSLLVLGSLSLCFAVTVKPHLQRKRIQGQREKPTKEEQQQAFNVMKMLFPVPIFYATVFQIFSIWVNQASDANRHFGSFVLPAANTTMLNFVFDIIMVPVFSLGIIPLVKRMGIIVTDLRKIGAGLIFTAFALLASGCFQLLLDTKDSESVSVWLVCPQYFLLSCGEVLAVGTYYEFAYTQSAMSVKSTMTGFLLFSISLGNFLLVALQLIPLEQQYMLFGFAGLMGVVVVIFWLMARKYEYRKY